MEKNIFEKNPKKTITGFLILMFLIFDFSAGNIINEKKEIIKKAARIPHEYFHHGLAANFSGVDYWGDQQYSLQTNSLGFKGTFEKEIKKKKEKRRILFLGDSFTEGIGIAYEDSFVGILEKKYPEFEILNAGVAGYSPKLYFLKMKYVLEEVQLELDELIVFVDLSDVLDEFRYRDFLPTNQEKRSTTIRKIKQLLESNSLVYNRLRYFKNNYRSNKEKEKHRAKPVAEKLAKDFIHTDPLEGIQYWTVDEKMFSNWGEEGLEMAMSNMDSLYLLCQMQNIKMTVAIYPWPVQIKRNEIDSKQVLAWKNFTQARNIRLINYFPDFILEANAVDQQQFFIEGDIHWNKMGHQKIAEKIVNDSIL